MSTESGKIFNVAEPQGAEQVQFETTAATAQVDAPSSTIAREVEHNAERAHDAALQAASSAKMHGALLTGETTTAAGQFKHEASATTNAAVAQGQHDVEAAKAAGAGYVEQAKALAGSALATAQSYLPAAVGGTSNTTTTTTDHSAPTATGTASETLTNIASTVQAGAVSALETAKGYVAAAHETGLSAAQPHLEKAKETVQANLPIGTQPQVAPPASSTGIPATTAPLESGPHTVGTPYPATTTTTGSGLKVAENA
ncbi:hypothetical protein HGRIS_008209 [Hohenbuehelia grisea]|uniref:Uncharacterized protein n=1 Tax=Hohenbuehelia grisea TaxID=104357 RepID=A0ABR3J7Q5_9AGAR